MRTTPKALGEKDLKRYALNQITIARASFEEACRLIAEAGIGGIGVWRDKVAEVGVPAARAIVERYGLFVSSVNIGGLFSKDGREGLPARIEDTRRAIDEARGLGASSLCMVAGGLPPKSADLHDAYCMFVEGLDAVLPHARAAGIRLLLEPLHPMYVHDWSTLTSIRKANDLCDRFGEGVGLSFDIYHTFWDLELEREIRRAASHPGRIGIYVISDWLPVTRSLNDRGMLGDGVIDLRGTRALLEEVAGYEGVIELEIFSDEIWGKPPAEVVALARERFFTSA